MQKQYVRTLFDSIAYRYDFLNHLLSGGVDLYWRRVAVEALRDSGPEKILDVATGTGDFAVAALRLNPQEVVGVDISERMLAFGKKKIQARGLERVIRLEAGDAEHLHFTDETFDAAIVAFGVRNFEHIGKGISEMYRVLKPEGRIVVLEFSKPRIFPFKQIYFFYFLNILPLIGRIVSKDRAAYRYLPETVLKFPDGEEFVSVLRAAGFVDATSQPLTFGIATLYMGRKKRKPEVGGRESEVMSHET
ncbi:MAG: bifunctional demethylmenaquinone methyltransferase/2-methoxy-6-polyprenyl-1,4-benzoquinol methylase UbiE [Bacteroidota bacterium]|nr:bifunctional demethylmenaquinone methyltransferase/2-methoxy-6-polyprenyl-1,4-benzoquinol methylase UbiE [Bacteroidota bacterium]